MKKLLFGLAAVSALSVAAPAAAQYSRDYWNSTRDWDITRERRLADLERRLDIDVRQGVVSPSELPHLRGLLWQTRQTKARYARNGFSGWERGDLDRAIDRLNGELRFAEVNQNGRADRGGRYPGYPSGWEDRDSGYNTGVWGGTDDDGDRDDAWDRDDDRQGDRGYDRSGRRNDPQSAGRADDGWDDSDAADRGNQGWDSAGRGAPQRGQWSGPSRTANPDDGTPLDLRVGDPAPVNLGAVPQQYRSRYPDGNGVYYRYDNGRVFQVDKKTDTIRWVGSLD